MSVSKRVAEAIDKFAANDCEAALYQIASAIDATSQAEFGRQGKSSYKRFIDENMPIITQAGVGTPIKNVNFGYAHPKIEPVGPGNVCRLQDIFYHAIRCGLMHDACMPNDIEFSGTAFSDFTTAPGKLRLHPNLINGFIVAVVLAPVNVSERIGSNYRFVVSNDVQLVVDKTWGRRAELTWLFDAMRP